MKITQCTLIIFTSLILIAGCRTMPLVDISSQSIPLDHNDEVSAEQISDAIERACKRRRWVPYQVDDHTIIASLYIRGHSATVRIEFDTTSYSINYVDSEALHYSAKRQRIHGKYNSWVERLDQQICIELSKLSDDV